MGLEARLDGMVAALERWRYELIVEASQARTDVKIARDLVALADSIEALENRASALAEILAGAR